MKHFIDRENLGSIVYDEENGLLEINWRTGGQENAVCGISLKVELIKKRISCYKATRDIPNDNYNNPF